MPGSIFFISGDKKTARVDLSTSSNHITIANMSADIKVSPGVSVGKRGLVAY